MKNAFLMADLAGSKVITEDELDSTTLRTAIEEIIGTENLLPCDLNLRQSWVLNYVLKFRSYCKFSTENESLMAEMSERALKVARPNASVEIAQQILSTVNSSVPKEK